MTEYVEIPQPDQIDIREKEDAMGAYFMMFAALAAGLPLPVLNLVAAIIYLYLNKKSRFVHFHSLQSLLSQLPTSVLNVGLVIWFIRIVFFDFYFDAYFKGYLAMTIAANLIYIIFSIIAAVKARKGQFYYFIFFGRLSYHYAYRKSASSEEKMQNLPPKL